MVKHCVIRENVAAPDYARNSEPAQMLINSYLTYRFALLKILKCSISSMVISNPRQNHFNPILSLPLSLSLSLSLNPLLCLSLLPLCLIPLSVLPVLIPHKYADDLMRGYHCNKLIEHELMFHWGITHNKVMRCVLQHCLQGAITTGLFTPAKNTGPRGL
jgi:hypothetical protein